MVEDIDINGRPILYVKICESIKKFVSRLHVAVLRIIG
jgi:hypothetical protein